MTATDPTTAPAQPATPGQTLRKEAEQLIHRWGMQGLAERLSRIADELDAAPAAPDKLAADFARWLEHRDLPPGTTLSGLIRHEREVAAIQARFEAGPLSTAPPAGTGAERDG